MRSLSVSPPVTADDAGRIESERLEPMRNSEGRDGDDALNLSQWDETRAVRTAANRELHADLVRLGAARFSGIALASAAGFALYATLGAVASMGGTRVPMSWNSPAVEVLGVGLLLSIVAYGFTKLPRLRGELVHALSYAHLFAISFILALFRYVEPAPSTTLLHQVSPIVIPILAYGALIPALPRTAALVSFGAAAMDPLAMAFLRGRGSSAAPLDWVLAIASPLLAALVAQRISRVVYRLSEGMVKAREIGSYRLVERLGVGGMAEVWRAEHRMLARPAAVKLIRPEVLIAHGPHDSQRLLRHFLREARTTASLNSPHTIHVYDFGIAREGTFYYVMELLDGVNLQQLVERFGQQPPERVARVLLQVCHSLDEAHARSFVHRDIKPANVYLCHHGEDYDFVKVLDFGLVLDRHPTAEEIADEQHQVGTPAVMAPEMVRFQAPVDARADLYAVGCVAYWLLTGKRVFEATTRHDMLIMHAHQKPIPPSRRVPLESHPGLERLVMGCLEKSPAKRPQSAKELADLLTGLAFDQPWSDERAEAWWKRMRPTALGR